MGTELFWGKRQYYFSMGITIKTYEAHIALTLDRLRTGSPLPFDVLVKEQGLYKTVFRKGMVLRDIEKNSLKRANGDEVFVRAVDESALESYLYGKSQRKDSPYLCETAFKDYSFHKHGHFLVDRDALVLLNGQELNFNVLLLSRCEFKLLLAASEEAPAKTDKISTDLPGDVVITRSSVPLYYERLNSFVNSDSLDEPGKTGLKRLMMKELLKIQLSDLYHARIGNPDIFSEKILALRDFVRNLLAMLSKDFDAIYKLLSLKNYDLYTYTHSLNVALMSVGLGLKIGLKGDSLEDLCIGSLLHDIGKIDIPLSILDKQGRLDTNEYQTLKTHVIDGESYLKEQYGICPDMFIPLLQHHEKLSGKGYPFRLKGDEVKLFGRISGIADCFDMLIAQRAYRQALTPYSALSVIAKETSDYDSELLKQFVVMFAKIK